MTNISSVSVDEIKQRRQALKHQRRMKTGQSVWRSLLVSAMAMGLLWGLGRSHWGLWHPAQVQIDGNQFLSEAELRALLPIDYPQSLLEFSNQAFVAELQRQAPVSEAIATRQLFPPLLKLRVQERPPVAIAILLDPASDDPKATQKGWLDATGTLVPGDYYQNSDEQLTLPTLKVLGDPAQYHQHWPKLYQSLIQTSIDIHTVDWRDTTNLILKTALAEVHLGPLTEKLSQQLKALENLGELSRQVPLQKIAYIDLINPETPAIKLK